MASPGRGLRAAARTAGLLLAGAAAGAAAVRAYEGRQATAQLKLTPGSGGGAAAPAATTSPLDDFFVRQPPPPVRALRVGAGRREHRTECG